MFNNNERDNMNIAETKMESGLTFQQVMLLNALRRQAKSGMLMTNPRVTGYTSFAKAVLAFINDDNIITPNNLSQ